MKKLVILLVGLCGMTSFVQASPELKKAINDKASAIQLKLFDSQASDEQLTEALKLMDTALGMIASENPGINQACVEWAYPLYYQSQSASEAQASASKSCRGFVDLEVAKWLYAKHYQNQNAATSVDLATQGAKRAQGKLPIIEFAYGKYYQNLNATESATKAGNGATMVLASAKACLERAYGIHYQNHNAAESMDLAFQDCRP